MSLDGAILLGPNYLHWSLKMEGLSQLWRERDVIMEAGSERGCRACFEDGKMKPQVKEYRCSLEAGQSKETILSQSLQKKKKQKEMSFG